MKEFATKDMTLAAYLSYCGVEAVKIHTEKLTQGNAREWQQATWIYDVTDEESEDLVSNYTNEFLTGRAEVEPGEFQDVVNKVRKRMMLALGIDRRTRT